MTQNEHPIHHLDDKMCWSMLQANSLGRLAVSADDDVDIFPINYFADGSTLLFRTAPGTKLASLSANSRVAVEIDGTTGVEAWSVVVKGTAHVLTDPADVSEADEAPLNPWAPTEKKHYVRIIPTAVTGRFFDRADV